MNLQPVELFSDSGENDSSLFAFVNAPLKTKRGTTLRFTVELTNNSSQPVSLSTCPTYEERLYLGGVVEKERYKINCAAMRSIPPQSTVVFAMQIPVPADAPAEFELDWRLEEGPLSTKGYAPIEITP